MKQHLELTQVSIEFPTPKGPFKALDNIGLKIKKGEFVSLIGHSGCGKSTVLNIVAGLYKATEGEGAPGEQNESSEDDEDVKVYKKGKKEKEDVVEAEVVDEKKDKKKKDKGKK